MYACMCGEREGLGTKSFPDLTDRNTLVQYFGNVFFFYLKKTTFSNENDSSQVLRS